MPLQRTLANIRLPLREGSGVMHIRCIPENRTRQYSPVLHTARLRKTLDQALSEIENRDVATFARTRVFWKFLTLWRVWLRDFRQSLPLSIQESDG